MSGGSTDMRNTLRFSLRRDADELTLEQIRERVEPALGCALAPGGERYDMFLYEGEVLGMQVLLGEWRGIRDGRTFQLHGSTPAPAQCDSEWVTTNIDAVVIDLLRARGAGQWRTPSEEEIMAEAEYGARREREEQQDAAERLPHDPE